MPKYYPTQIEDIVTWKRDIMNRYVQELVKDGYYPDYHPVDFDYDAGHSTSYFVLLFPTKERDPSKQNKSPLLVGFIGEKVQETRDCWKYTLAYLYLNPEDYKFYRYSYYQDTFPSWHVQGRAIGFDDKHTIYLTDIWYYKVYFIDKKDEDGYNLEWYFEDEETAVTIVKKRERRAILNEEMKNLPIYQQKVRATPFKGFKKNVTLKVYPDFYHGFKRTFTNSNGRTEEYLNLKYYHRK